MTTSTNVTTDAMPKSNSRSSEASTSAKTLDSRPERKGKGGGAKPRNGKGKAPYPVKKPSADGAVGASKIKAALRQTRRLLAKVRERILDSEISCPHLNLSALPLHRQPNLAQDVRQEAERRLISLEADLAKREESEKERKNADRYHKVRFFERQKLVRQIKKIKKGKGTANDDEELKEKRVLLNYVLVSTAVSAYHSPLVAARRRRGEGHKEDDQTIVIRNLVSLTQPWG